MSNQEKGEGAVTHVIEVKHLTKCFGEQIIFADVSLKFESGKIYGLVGRNGSGKTVFLKCICGFMEAENGVILQDGRQLKRDMEYLENMGFLIERPGFLENLSAYENLKYIASIRRLVGKEQIEECLKQVRLDPKDKKRVGKYSMGMKQRLGVAQAIMENPDILILDEPMNGMDDAGVEFMRTLLLRLKQEGKLIFIASHYQEDIRLLCDRVYRFFNGTVQEQDGTHAIR